MTGGVLVAGAHRVIRVLGGDEGPFRGALVTNGGELAVQADAEAKAGWVGWRHAGDEHVAGPIDIVRRADGHDVLLPWCTERVDRFVSRRIADGEALSAGEVTTLMASMLRGLGELQRAGSVDVVGEWWLADDGRPMFVCGSGGDAWDRSAQIADHLLKECVDRTSARILSTIAEGMRAGARGPGASQRRRDAWEQELLADAAPRPLRREARTQGDTSAADVIRRARDGAETTTRVPFRQQRPRSGPATRPTRLGWVALVGAASTAALSRAMTLTRLVPPSMRLDDGTSSVRRRERRRSAPAREEREARGDTRGGRATTRRRWRFVLPAAAAGVVVLAGFLVPGGSVDESRGGEGEPSPSSREDDAEDGGGRSAGPRLSADPRPSPPESPSPSAAPHIEPDEIEIAARELVHRIIECGDREDRTCDGAVVPGAEGAVDALRGFTLGEGAVIELVDEYGDVAVMRLSGAARGRDVDGGAGPVVVLVRQKDEWLVRDVYDVADQPG